MQTIHCYTFPEPVDREIRIAVVTLGGSLAFFELYVENVLKEPEWQDSGGAEAMCSWRVPRDANPCRCTLQILPAQQAGESSDAQISITQAGHVVTSVDNNNNPLTPPIRVSGTASGGDGLSVIYLNYK